MTAPPDLVRPVHAEPAPRRGPGFIAFVAGAAVVLLIVGAVGAVALLRALDFGDRMASAEAMPTDTQLYVDIDFGSLDDLDRLLMAFDAAFAEAAMEPGLDGIVDLLDDELRAQFGIGVDDVTPWVGRDLGIGVAGLHLPPSGLPDASVVAAVSVRDDAGADAFVDRMVGILADRDMMTFAESFYGDVRILASELEFDGQQFAAARSGELLLLANSEAAIRRAIDAQGGTSLADDAAMQDLLDELPRSRALTVYVSESLFAGLADDLAGLELGAIAPVPLDDFEATAVSAALTDDGIQLDVVQRRDPTAQGLTDVAAGPGSTALPGMLPEGTFAYFGVAGDAPLFGDDMTLEALLADAGLGEAELAEVRAALAELEAFLGFDIDEGLLRHLGGDLGFALFPSAQALFGDPFAPQVGFMGLVGVMDPDRVAETAADFRSFLAEQGVPVAERRAADATLYAIGDGENDMVMFGVAGDYLVVASDPDDVAGLFDNGAKLADDELYQQARDALPQRGDPVLFVDLQRALGAFEAPPDAANVLAPVIGMVANADETETTSRFTLLTLIDY